MAPYPPTSLDAERGELLALAFEVVWDLNVLTGTLAWSPGLEAAYGFPPNSTPPTLAWWLEHVHEEDRAHTERTLLDALQGEANRWTAQYRFRRHDGSYVTVLDRAYIVRRDGRAVRAVGAMLDVSERTETELAVRRLEKQHRQILDAITDPVLVKGPQSRLVWANKAFRDAYGMTNEELQGLIDAPFVEPDTTLQYIRDDARVFATGEPVDIPDEPLTLHDGRVIRVHTVKSPIFNDRGEVVMSVGVSRDITERLRMEAQLILADRMSSVGTLAAGVAHEINNPLSYVMGNLELGAEVLRRAKGGGLDDTRVAVLLDLLSDAIDGSERMRKIVQGLKTFSRTGEETRAPLELAGVIELSLNMARNEIRHRATIVTELNPAPMVEADSTRLAQVFINLLVNAAQALPEGSASQNTIRITTQTDSVGRAVIEVSDTGCGMRPEVLSRIFDPFFTTKPIGVGTGLGLAICHGIISSLDGEITATSKVGVGTTFRIVLPPAKEVRSTGNAPIARLSAAPVRRGRVLILDDEEMVSATLRRILERDHDVVTLDDGRRALEMFSAGERFDVFFCDLMMPIMTGMDVYAALSKIAPDQLDRIVLISGGIFTQGAREFLDAVPNERLDKPFHIQNVRALVRRMVR